MVLSYSEVDCEYLIASDLDRTMLPNGVQEADPEAIPRLKRLLVENPKVLLVYASGRHLKLIQDAVGKYQIPDPDIVVCDVGTSIYLRGEKSYVLDEDWYNEISSGWPKEGSKEIGSLLEGIAYLEIQEREKLSFHKQSYYVDPETPKEKVLSDVEAILTQADVDAQLIYSLDEVNDIHLLDVLPKKAAKDSAVQYLMERLGLDADHVLYAGDSGNDTLALTSGTYAVVVNNAVEEVKKEVRHMAEEKGVSDRIYYAKGEYGCRNGYYTSGVLEAALHFKFFKETGD